MLSVPEEAGLTDMAPMVRWYFSTVVSLARGGGIGDGRGCGVGVAGGWIIDRIDRFSADFSEGRGYGSVWEGVPGPVRGGRGMIGYGGAAAEGMGYQLG